jgi:serine/threonine-protein kinase
MTQDIPEPVSTVFDRAIELPETERDSFIERECAAFPVVGEHVRRLIAERQTVAATATQVFKNGDLVARRFRIARLIGKGGMGEVYEAYDSELKDTIAIKTLRSEAVSQTQMIERFRKEVLRSRSVADPSVCKVYDLFAHELPDGTTIPFFTMQLLRGETLADWMMKNGPTPIEKALPLLQQMGRALKAAHSAGIVHRDFTPRNVFMEEREGNTVQPIITDFGLAVRAPSSLDSSVSRSFVAAGTPGYMAPEQRVGGRASPQTDIYALGLVAYQLVTGTKADGAAFLEDSQLPPHWLAAIRRCLMTDPEDRFPDVDHFIEALKLVPSSVGAYRKRTGAPALFVSVAAIILFIAAFVMLRDRISVSMDSQNSLAVLPFENSDSSKEAAYLSDGIAEDLSGALTAYPDLRVSARGSAFRFRGSTAAPREIGKALGVKMLLTGSVRRLDDRIRIAVQLIDADDDRQVWSDTYDRDFRQTIEIQGEITQEIGRVLHLKPAPAQSNDATPNIDAYDLFLKGKYYWNTRTREGLSKGLTYFQDAIQVDPKFALAYTGLADSYSVMVDYAWMPPLEALPKVRTALSKAVSLDPNLAETQASIGLFDTLLEWDQQDAEKAFQRAIAFKHSLMTAHLWYGNYLMRAGRLSEALREAEEARRLDPVSLPTVVFVGWVHYYSRNYPKALEVGNEAIELNPSFPHGYQLNALTYSAMGKTAEALKASDAVVKMTSDEAVALRYRGLALSMLPSMRSQGEEVASRLANLSPDRQAGYLAIINGGLGNREEMYNWMERALNIRDSSLLLANIAPGLDRYRSESRFRQILRRVGY